MIHLRRVSALVARRIARLHDDQRGTISIMSVFSLLMFTFLLVMTVNLARHFDDKIKMQNAADTATYSGGLVLARGMNATAFANNMLSDVIAITAFLREARDRNSEKLVPEILQKWEEVGQAFSQAEFDKFRRLGAAITAKVPLERQLVSSFSELHFASSQYALPVFEGILQGQMLPNFQRTVVRIIPEMAQRTTAEIAMRQATGSAKFTRSNQTAVLWRMTTPPIPVSVPDEEDPNSRTLPAVDPDPAQTDAQAVIGAQQYFQMAVHQRRELARHHLESWTRDVLSIYDPPLDPQWDFRRQMSQFNNLWRIFTNYHLQVILEQEYPQSNLPHVMRMQTPSGLGMITTQSSPQERNMYLGETFHFLGLVYRDHVSEQGPKLFRNPVSKQSDALAFSQCLVYLPEPRTLLVRGPIDLNFMFDTQNGQPGAGVGGGLWTEERWGREGWPHQWDQMTIYTQSPNPGRGPIAVYSHLLAQNWTVKLVPATDPQILEAMQTNPGGVISNYRLPQLPGGNMQDMHQINTH